MRAVLVMAIVSACMMSVVAAGEGCAATPEAAARAVLGTFALASSSQAGFRAEEVEIDPVLQRAWVRVRRCGAPDAPAVLVPFSIPVKPAATTMTSVAVPAVHEQRVAVLQPLLVHTGDRVRAVFTSQAMHMEVEAQAMQSGGEGQTIALMLNRPADATADEPEHRIHGIVRATGMVEVIP